jgi:hypothetical protein
VRPTSGVTEGEQTEVKFATSTHDLTRTAMIIGALLLITIPGLAQTHQRIPISITFSGNDTVGQRFMYDLKSELARSAIY